MLFPDDKIAASETITRIKGDVWANQDDRSVHRAEVWYDTIEQLYYFTCDGKVNGSGQKEAVESQLEQLRALREKPGMEASMSGRRK